MALADKYSCRHSGGGAYERIQIEAFCPVATPAMPEPIVHTRSNFFSVSSDVPIPTGSCGGDMGPGPLFPARAGFAGETINW